MTVKTTRQFAGSADLWKDTYFYQLNKRNVIHSESEKAKVTNSDMSQKKNHHSIPVKINHSQCFNPFSQHFTNFHKKFFVAIILFIMVHINMSRDNTTFKRRHHTKIQCCSATTLWKLGSSLLLILDYLSASGSRFNCFEQVRTDVQGAPKATHQLINHYYTVLSSANIAR